MPRVCIEKGAGKPKETGSLFLPRRSRAKELWLLVIAAVLATLYVETRQTQTLSYNLLLNGESACAGAVVFIDGVRVGRMKRTGRLGLGGAAFWTLVKPGRHVISVRKQGYVTFFKQADLSGQRYVAVRMKPATGLETNQPRR